MSNFYEVEMEKKYLN